MAKPATHKKPYRLANRIAPERVYEGGRAVNGASALTKLSHGEAELIGRAQTGDTRAFCELAQKHERRIYSLALHYCRNSHDAEDLSQEVWLKAYQALNTFRGESSFYTWLRKIMINCFLNHRRNRSFAWRQRMTNVEALNEALISDERPTTETNSERALHHRVLIERVGQALSEVTPQQRMIFLLKHYEGLTCEEIAKNLNCSVGTVKKSLFRTVARLREHLDVKSEMTDCVPCAAGQY